MASEITIQSKLTATKGGSSVTNYTSDFTLDMDTDLTKMSVIVQSVGTSSREAVQVGDVDVAAGGAPAPATDNYWIRLQNNDSTNFVTVEVQTGAATYWALAVMGPGDCFGPVKMIRTDGSGYGGLFVTANTAACDVEVVACDCGA